MDVSPLGQFAPWTFRPEDVSLPGRFTPWMSRHLDGSPPGRFALWTFRHHQFAPLSGNQKGNGYSAVQTAPELSTL